MKRFSKLLAAALASGCIGITPLSIAQDREVAPNEAATPKAQTLPGCLRRNHVRYSTQR